MSPRNTFSENAKELNESLHTHLRFRKSFILLHFLQNHEFKVHGCSNQCWWVASLPNSRKSSTRSMEHHHGEGTCQSNVSLHFESSNTQDLFHYFVHTNTSFWNFTLRFQPQTKLIWVHSFFSYCQPEPYEDVFMHIVFMCCQPEPLKHIDNMFSTKGDMTSVIQPLVHTPIPFFANLNCRSYVHHKGCNDKFPSKCTSHDRWRSFTDNCAEAQTGSDHGTWPSSTRAN